MTRVTFWEPSGETVIPGKGPARDHFSSGAFVSAIGKRVPFRQTPGGPQIGWATVIEVIVDDDGLGATWTVDTDLDAGDFPVRPRVGMSFAFRPEPDPGEAGARDPLAARPLVIRTREES